MSARKQQFFRSPKTTNERRQNGGFHSIDPEFGIRVKGRIRTGNRLPDIRYDKEPAVRRDRWLHKRKKKPFERKKFSQIGEK